MKTFRSCRQGSARLPRSILLASAFVLAMFLNGQMAGVKAQPSEQQILDALMKKRLMRCPPGTADRNCGEQPAFQAEAFEVYFELASASLDQHARATLTALSAELNKPENTGRTFLIGGHTDARGSDAYNLRLSERRATAVRDFLAGNGVDAGIMRTAGFGKHSYKNPADPFADENRRVAVTLLSEK